MSSKGIAVSVKGIHKEFILPQSKDSTFKQSFVNIVKKGGKVTQKTLDGVSFDVHKGDFFGIVGRNGSGKSTLLKLIAGVYSPTTGHISLSGGLTPFIELGVGFNPELSGRDNVYLNGALLGFTRKQVAAIYDEIVDFAELEPFMDQKLKNYSSGMQVRLAFSIAIKAKSDILIFDEVLAVGDEAFQRKCLDVFEQYKAEGQTVILVTHDMATVKNFCNRAVLINEGKVEKIGDPNAVADAYSDLNQSVIDKETVNRQARKSDDRIKVVLQNPIESEPQYSFKVGERMRIAIEWSKDIPADAVVFDIYKRSGEHITTLKSNRGDKRMTIKGIGIKHVAVDIDLRISPGKYNIIASLRTAKHDKTLLIQHDAAEFMIVEDWSLVDPAAWSGLIDLPHSWIVKN